MKRLLSGLVLLAVVGAACGGEPPHTLTVLAATSLTEAFDELGRTFEHRHPDVRVALRFAASSTLARQVVAGGPGDVLATADEATMATVTSAGLASNPAVFARNRLAVLVAPGNPRRVTGLADLARPGLTVVLCAPEVPCGRAAAEALRTAAVEVRPASLEENARAVVSRVALGEADAGLAFATDTRAGGVEGLALPDTQSVATAYPIVALHPSAAARAWVDHVLSTEGQQVLARFGFTPR